MKKFIWLFGENLGKTANNNSFYFWKQIVNKEDTVEKYFILKKNKKNKEIFNKLDDNSKKYVVWQNSLKHYKIYKEADMFFVTLSYKDVIPTRQIFKTGVKTTTIYLQHGILGIKKIGYKGNSYNNNMFRFLYYNKDIKNTLIKENNFKDYQLYYGEFQPRYQELVKRYENFKKQKNNEKSILWFLTWREYFGNNNETERFLEDIKNTIENYKIKEFIKENNYKLKICLHQFFDKKKISYITKNLKEINIEIVTPSQIDVMDEVVKNDMLITDYSSIAFDFVLLGKRVILYQPDIKEYSKNREFYYLDEMKRYSIKSPVVLANELKNNKKNTNEFFRNKISSNIDFEYIKSGKHIERIYNDILNMQENEITFIGYNFYGTGGTVSATLALAEGLLEKNYLIKFISLKKTKVRSKIPNGINAKALYIDRKKNPKTLIKRLLFWNKKNFKYFKFDSNKKFLIPYVGYALQKKLNKIKSKTVISTRETMHLFLYNSKSENVKNKVYFFHTFYQVLQEQFVGLIDELKKIKIEKAVFITEAGKKQYEEKAEYKNYIDYEIINNCLESSKMISKEMIKPIIKKNKYDSAYFLRISKDRVADINNLIDFAKYMIDKKFNKLIIHVYGIGDYLDEFLDRIEKENLSKIIKYEGLAVNISEEMAKYDLITDFTLNHSFGMTYLEAIFNGKMVFGMINQGSREVFKDIPNCYINSYDDLINKIKNLDKITLKDLQKNYDLIYNKYSREVISERFIKFINK